jgi:hypothetical protein
MTAILRAALLVALASIPAVASGQRTSADSLLRRIDLLERRTTELELRVRELEALTRTAPSRDRPVPTSAKWRDVQNWRRLRLKMTMDEVRALLGEPDHVLATALQTYWSWGDGAGSANVYFDSRSGKLDGWTEPGR